MKIVWLLSVLMCQVLTALEAPVTPPERATPITVDFMCAGRRGRLRFSAANGGTIAASVEEEGWYGLQVFSLIKSCGTGRYETRIFCHPRLARPEVYLVKGVMPPTITQKLSAQIAQFERDYLAVKPE